MHGKTPFGKVFYHLRLAVKKAPSLFNRAFRGVVLSFDLLSRYWKRADYVYADGDFVRNSSLELAAREINEGGVEGAAAELGVFRGEYARLINRAFPDRKLYLFDSFEGFSADEESRDKDEGYSEIPDDFSNTSVELVLKRMKYPQNCVVKKGFFPGTADGLDETFCFVSIDCDLYKPIYSGLEYFWERLAKGGYIFVHDYQNPAYSGAKKAVREFCGKKNIPYFLMSDCCGTAVVSKGQE
ncbi:MAG: TylF/MycF family methyltransferase [Oscillospiraceae bacterium]|nr:TylF/MycF family methyltransferase [Oscillospiraceae bacterium]